MTNTQLATLLDAYRAQLETVLQKIEAALPDELEKQIQSPLPMGLDTFEYPETEPLRVFIDELGVDVERLLESEEDK